MSSTGPDASTEVLHVVHAGPAAATTTIAGHPATITAPAAAADHAAGPRPATTEPAPTTGRKPTTGQTQRGGRKRPRTTGHGEAAFLIVLDVLVTTGTGYAAGTAWPALTIRALAAPLALGTAGLYRARLRFSVLDDLPRLLLAVAAVVAAGSWLAAADTALGRILAPPALPRDAALLAAVITGRIAGYRLIRRHRRRSPGRVTLLFGRDDLALRLAEELRADRAYGLVPVGFVGTAPLEPPLPVLAPEAGLERAVRRYKPVHLIVTFPVTADAELVGALRRCRRGGVTVHVVPRLCELAVGGTELVAGIPLVRLPPEPTQTRRWRVKRMLDVCGAAAGIFLLAPVLLVCALAVLVESRRHGVLFRQERIGLDGRPFTILKFRSLTPESALESKVKWNINTDSRVGPIGRLLRSSSLDELPQLLNVLRGEMSLVGPRPERPFFVDQFARTYAGYPDRHRVPAGITGWAQIHGLRGDTSIEDRVRFDNHYIEHWSLGLDLKIILRTVGAMLSIHRV